MFNFKDLRKESRKLWLISYPTMISIALQSIYDIVDIAWVGQISKEATAAITIYSLIFWLFAVTNEIVASSSVSMLSQAYGKEDKKRFKYIAEQNIAFKLLVGLVTAGLLLLLQNYLMSKFLTDEISLKLGQKYGFLRTAFMPLLFLSYSVNTILRSSKDSKTPMRIMVFSTILNIILDPIMMFDSFNIFGIEFRGFNMGMFGAALATNIAILLTILLGLYFIRKMPKDYRPSFKNIFRIDWAIAKSFIKIGLPSGMEAFFRNISMAVLMWFVTYYGTAAVSVAGIGSKLFAFAFMPVYGFLLGGSTLIGQYLGQEDIRRADLVGKASSYNGTLFLLVIIGLAMIFPKSVMSPFIKDEEVINLGVNMIRIVGPALLLSAFIFGRAVVFLGSGYNKPILLASIIARWGVQVPLLYIFVKILKLGLNSIWFTFIAAEIADFAILYYFYIKGDWKRMRV